jgi:dTDP-4-dehydrorhamnose reductase
MMSQDLRWAVVGSGGMLAADLVRTLGDRDVRTFTRQQLDICDADALRDGLIDVDVVINCAAYTAVDDAESHEQQALAINGHGVRNLAEVCAARGTRLLHLSTDYVFSGDADVPYVEDAPRRPLTAYGRTKAEGEVAIRAAIPHTSWILRTAWLYGASGPNFVSTMKRLESERETIDVVDDQRGQPTWTRDLAARILLTVERDLPPGIYHATNSGSATWFELARAVFELLGADPDRVRPTTTDSFARPAARPAYSVLGHNSWMKAGVTPMRHWHEALVAAAPELLDR